MLRDRKIDVVCCGFESGIFLIVLLRRLFRYKPKIVMFEVNARGWRIRDRMLDFILPRLDGVLTLTEHRRQATNETYRLKRPAEVVGWSIDHNSFRPDPGAADEGYIFSIGDDAGRDYATLIEACRPLDCRVLLRTSAELAVDGGRAEFVRLDRMTFRELRACYARARIVVVSLKALSSPTGITSILEAMAMGKATIATDIGTTRDLIEDEVTGLVVPPGDAEALRHAIQCLLADPGLRERLGRAARATIEGPLSFHEHTRRLASALSRIAKGEPAPESAMNSPG